MYNLIKLRMVRILIIFEVAMNYSKVKECVFHTVLENRIHPTAEQIFNMMKEVNPSISLATIYRNLAKLVEEGRLKKIVGLGESDRYDANIKNHCHFYCKNCGNVYDVDIDNDVIKKIQEKIPHKIDEVNFALYGICKDCIGGNYD